MAYDVLTKNVDLVDSIVYYQIDCIDKHPEMSILPIHVTVHPPVCLEIDVSDKISLKDHLLDHTFTRRDWIGLLISAGETILRGIEFFLDPRNFEISMSTVFFLSKQEDPGDGDYQYLYIPLIKDSPADPIHPFCMEILQFLSSSHHLSEDLFSQEEKEQIETWSLDGLEDGLTRFRSMLEWNVLPDRAGRKIIKNKEPFAKTDSVLSKKDRKVIKKAHSAIKKSQNWLAQNKFLSKSSRLPLIFGVLVVEIVFLYAGFQVLQHQNAFFNRQTPILLVSSILLCFGFLDFFLLYSKKSPLYLEKSKDSGSSAFFEEKDSESILKSREEKTVLLAHAAEIKRIAMICTGFPGTPEESAGLKAYILVDDFLIGRDGSKVDFKINCQSVGRIHARILRRENSFFIEDLESRNGTYLDQKRLKKKEEYLLPENCKIRFAEKEFYFVAN